MYHQARFTLLAGNCDVDPLIDDPHDQRFGLTLIIRPGQTIYAQIKVFLHDLSAIEPHQYYYPGTDMHVTVMPIITCYTGFEMAQIALEGYVDTIQASLEELAPFQLEFNGVTASPSCVMVQGFFGNNTLNKLRENLRKKFHRSLLTHSLDVRYTIQTAHMTVTRFRHQLTQKQAFLQMLDKYREYDFGTITVETLELVYNDWYHRGQHERLLWQFDLQ